MGKHSKVEPKRISFLASAGGAVAGLALIGSLFAASSVNKPDDKEIVNEPVAEAPQKPTTADPLLLGNATTVATVDAPVRVPTAVAETTEIIRPPAPPVVAPELPEARTGPTVDINTEVQIPPVAGVDVDAEVDVPLVGKVVDTATGVVEEVTEPVIGTVKDLLGK